MASLEELLAQTERVTPEGQAFGNLLQKLPAGAGYFGGLDYMQRMQDQNRVRGKIQQQDESMAVIKDVLQKAGGNPEAAIQALLATGDPVGVEMATKIRGLAPKPGLQQIGTGLYDPSTQTVISPPKEPKTQAPFENVHNVPEGYLTKNQDGSVKFTRTTQNKMDNPMVKVVADDTSPTKFSWWDVKNDKLLSQGAPAPSGSLNLAGGRESVYVQRMMMGANQAAKDLANVVQLPLTASTGIFGGRRQGPGLLDANFEILANKATTQEAQAYNAMATGFQRSLAQIESAGLMPSGSLTHQMDAVIFKEGDTNLTKLHKLAQTRQIVEAGMEVIEANPRVTPEEKSKVKSVLTSIRQSVPFTHSDLIKLQVAQETNPNATLKDIIASKQGTLPKEGDKQTSRSGRPMIFRNNQWEYE